MAKKSESSPHMAGPPRRAKSETLSLRLDPRSKFILEFVGRVRGQNITTVIERAIREVADKVSVAGGKTWSTYWDPDENFRTVNMLSDPDYPKTYDEEEIAEFLREHWSFFYGDRQRRTPRRGSMKVLWPKIDEYLRKWRDGRATNYWGAGEAMAKDLLAAQIAAPEWPPNAKPKDPPKESFNQDLDDEIPF